MSANSNAGAPADQVPAQKAPTPKASVSEEIVSHVAKLARLEVSDEERAMFAEQLSDVLSYGQEMSELDLSDVLPTSHPYPITNVLRSDEATGETSNREEVLAVAPEAQDNQFRVPPVLGE